MIDRFGQNERENERVSKPVDPVLCFSVLSVFSVVSFSKQDHKIHRQIPKNTEQEFRRKQTVCSFRRTLLDLYHALKSVAIHSRLVAVRSSRVVRAPMRSPSAAPLEFRRPAGFTSHQRVSPASQCTSHCIQRVSTSRLTIFPSLQISRVSIKIFLFVR